jgi:phage/plasmid primase-like uncharacterized protein
MNDTAPWPPIEDEIFRRGLQLKRVGAELIGPCPACGGKDRFAVNFAKQLWHCRKCDVGGDIVQLIRHLDGVGFADAVEKLTGERPRASEDVSKQLAARRAADAAKRRDDIAYCNSLWRRAVPLPGEAVGYFAARKIDIDAVPDHGGLRFLAQCPFGDGNVVPCIVARFTDAITGEVGGLWRRPLDGRKPKTVGPIKGCVIRLWPQAGPTLTVGEGPETVLSVARVVWRGAPLAPAWAATYADNLKNFSVLPGVERLTIAADNDANGVGKDAARACAMRWREAGRHVEILTPKLVGDDFNDLAKRAEI